MADGSRAGAVLSARALPVGRALVGRETSFASQSVHPQHPLSARARALLAQSALEPIIAQAALEPLVRSRRRALHRVVSLRALIPLVAFAPRDAFTDRVGEPQRLIRVTSASRVLCDQIGTPVERIATLAKTSGARDGVVFRWALGPLCASDGRTCGAVARVAFVAAALGGRALGLAVSVGMATGAPAAVGAVASVADAIAIRVGLVVGHERAVVHSIEHAVVVIVGIAYVAQTIAEVYVSISPIIIFVH